MDILPRVMCKALQCLGVFPAKLHTSSNGQNTFKACPKLYLVSLTVVSTQILLTVGCLYVEVTQDCHSWRSIELTPTVMVLVKRACLQTATVVNFISVTKCLDELISVYTSLQVFSDFFHKPSRNNVIENKGISTIFLLVILNIWSCIGNDKPHKCVSLLQENLFFVQSLVIFSVCWQFHHICEVCAEYFRAINSEIQQEMDWHCCALLFKDIQGYLSSVKTLQLNMLPISKIKTLAEMYWQLCDIVQRANSFINPQLFFSIISSFVVITLSLHQFFLSIENVDGSMMMQQAFWIFFSILQLVILTWPSEYIMDAAEGTAPVLCRYMNKEMDPEVRSELEIFLLQLLHQNPSFSALGFFPIHRHILTSIAGSVTTYLVILIQFQYN